MAPRVSSAIIVFRIAAGLLFAALGGVAYAAVQLHVTADGQRLVVDNGAITATFQLVAGPAHVNLGNLVSLRTPQTGELLGNGGMGYFLATADSSNRVLTGGEYRVVRETDDLVEFMFRRRFADMAFELHYVIRDRESGIYVFLVQRHEPGMAPMPDAQTIYTLRVDPTRFDYAFTGDARSGPLVTPESLQRSEKVQDATFQLPDGTVYTKYDWADFWDHHWGHGLTGHGSGLWMLPGAGDYLVGGPTKQELTVHTTDTTPVILQIFIGGHFLGDKSTEPAITGDWAKLSGPAFIYVNTGATPQAMRDDAKRKAQELSNAWPYRWLDNSLYPLARGTVSGRLLLGKNQPAAGATMILAAPAPDWQKQWSTYNFWTHADANGAFTLPKVRPGSYTLYSFVPEILGEFRRDEIVVNAGQTNDLGDLAWVPPAHGQLLWQIGVPDRSAGEFRWGDAPRQYGLWHHYFQDFPQDVNFTIGQSRERTDWNYVQPVLQMTNGEYHLPVWTIHFELTNTPVGEGVLTLAIAGVQNRAHIEMLVNGTKAGRVTLDNDSSVRRSANQAGLYRVSLVRFDAALLKAGSNTVSLALRTSLPEDGERRDYPIAAVMYDCVRLEVLPIDGFLRAKPAERTALLENARKRNMIDEATYLTVKQEIAKAGLE